MTPRPTAPQSPTTWLLLALALLGACEKADEAPPSQPPPQTAPQAPPPLTITACRITPQRPCPPDGPLTTGADERAHLTLSDGTTLWLHHDTTTSLLPGRALAISSGQAFLDVAPHQGEPLALALPTGSVEVTGTQLQVRATPKSSVVDVLHGQVTVRSAGQEASVGQGGEAHLTEGESPLVHAAGNLGAMTEWLEPPDAEPIEAGFGTLRARRPGRKEDAELALRLAEHRVDVRLQGEVARTTIEETFANDTDHTMEGIYSFPLPPGAKIAGLDLLVGETWEHGAMVERERANRIWAGVIRNAAPKAAPRERVEYIWVPGPWEDPALLQWTKGSQFELKIFPIPKRGSRSVRITYTEVLREIPGGHRYILPLAADPSGKARTDRFVLNAVVGLGAEGALRVSPYPVERTIAGHLTTLTAAIPAFAPRGDLVIEVPDRHPGAEMRTYAYRDQDAYALLALRPPLPAPVDHAPLTVLFVIDTSYSTQAARLARAGRLIERVIAGLSPDSQVHALACSSSCRALTEGFRPADDTAAQDIRHQLGQVEPLGATRLDGALLAAAEALKGANNPRVIYMGDGIPTSGETDPARLADRAAQALEGVGLTTVSLGGERDDTMLNTLAMRCQGSTVAHAAGASLRSTAWLILQRLTAQPLRDVTVSLPGAREMAPSTLGTVWPGEERLVTMRLDGDIKEEVVLRGTLNGEPWERRYPVSLAPAAKGGNAFLPRLWAEQRIAELEGLGDGAREEIVRLSRAHHVLSRHTSLLVLESPAMARAFKVEDTRPPMEWSGEEAAEADVVEAKGEAPRAMSKAARPVGQAIMGMTDFHSSGRRPTRIRPTVVLDARIRPYGGVLASERKELNKRLRSLADNPESRNRTRDLLRWHVRMGEWDQARVLAERWLEKDRMDAEALVELSGLEALAGNMERSLNLLASAVEVAPGSVDGHTRMIALYRAGQEDALACAHSLTRALVASKDWKHQVAAIRCGSEEARHLMGLSKGGRRSALGALKRAEKQAKVSDRLTLDAAWEGNSQLDILVVTPKGRVVTWLGGAKRTRVQDAGALGREKLAMSMGEMGRYQVFLVQRGASSGPVRGTLDVRAHWHTKRMDFATHGRLARVADVTVTRETGWRRSVLR